MDIFFDNSILKNVLSLSRPQNAEAFHRSFTQILETSGIRNPHYISTPLMLLEYLGEILQPLQSRSPRLFEEVNRRMLVEPFDANRVITDVLSLLVQELEGLERTQFGYLIERLECERRFRTPFGAALADILYSGNLNNPLTRYRFIHELATDELQGIDLLPIYGPLAESERIPRILSSLSKFLAHDTFNVSITRAVHQLYLASSSPEAIEAARICRYDFTANHQDRLDTQLIHFACCGHKRDDYTHAVICFTMEDQKRSINRCKAYLQHVAHIQRYLVTVGIAFSPQPGRIVQVGPNGEVVANVDLVELWEDALAERDRPV